MGWNVVTMKYGRRLQAAFARDGGEELRRWIDDCPNSLYSALTFQGGAAWRQAMLADLGRVRGVRAILDPLSRRRTRRADDQSRRPRHRNAHRAVPRGRRGGRPADLLHRLHDQGHGPAVRRPQGQPCRADDQGADGSFPHRHGHPPRPRMGSVRGPDGQRRGNAGVSRQRAVRDAADAGRPRADRADHRHAGGAAGAENRGAEDVHPGRVRRHPRGNRSRPGGAEGTGGAHRHHQPRRRRSPPISGRG